MAAPTEQRQRYLIGGPISPIDDQDQIPLNGPVNILKHKDQPSSKLHKKELCEEMELVFDIAHPSWQQDVDIEKVAPLTDQTLESLPLINPPTGIIHSVAKSPAITAVQSHSASKGVMEDLRQANLLSSTKYNLRPKKNPGERSKHGVADSAQNSSTGSTPTSSQEINPSQQSSSSAGYLPGGRDYENQSVRGTVNIMNADVVSALDIGGVTYRNTMRIFSAVAKVLRVPIKNLILNKTSFCRMRKKIREERSGQIMTCFGRSDLNASILHVDGRRMLDKTTHIFIERLPVVLSDGKTTKIISIPKLDYARGKTQAHAVYNELVRLGLVESIKGICLDTTASNLGRHSGLAGLLEQLLEESYYISPAGITFIR
ncbi:hypothetical protein QAD02_013561 [Eretmocerus hayati]|uniref:Uncharacterized protein n=1 Tax=Eretmocerus hayati TaxID=131215 RepID=A0ACC2P372_9HYME|nr:hypothetical protein QAD02_013561 [Eretmocerus hayati]